MDTRQSLYGFNEEIRITGIFNIVCWKIICHNYSLPTIRNELLPHSDSSCASFSATQSIFLPISLECLMLLPNIDSSSSTKSQSTSRDDLITLILPMPLRQSKYFSGYEKLVHIRAMASRQEIFGNNGEGFIAS